MAQDIIWHCGSWAAYMRNEIRHARSKLNVTRCNSHLMWWHAVLIPSGRERNRCAGIYTACDYQTTGFYPPEVANCRPVGRAMAPAAGGYVSLGGALRTDSRRRSQHRGRARLTGDAGSIRSLGGELSLKGHPGLPRRARLNLHHRPPRLRRFQGLVEPLRNLWTRTEAQ